MKYDDQYWEKRFYEDTPERVKTAIKRIYDAYPVERMPQGLADHMYIMNVICLELGIGDGQGNFYLDNRAVPDLVEAMQYAVQELSESWGNPANARIRLVEALQKAGVKP